MEILGPKEASFIVDDDLLNFTLEGEAEEEEETTIFKGASASSSSLESSFSRQNQTGSFPEFVEEELEWLSNKDAFPAVETCFGILSDNLELVLSHHSPVSVLQNNNNSSSSNSSNGSSIASCCDSLKVPTNYPVRARSKRRRRRRSGFADLPSQHCLWLTQANVKNKQELSSFSLPPLSAASNNGASMGRRCLHCHADKTPQWRAGPMGPKTLCNACGVRFKSGRLLPEYRPASSPTFSRALHSNSHRKVVEMRKQKLGQGGGEGIAVNVACGYNRVG